MDRKTISTWDSRAKFSYDGSVRGGTQIFYGKKPWKATISASSYDRILKRFSGQDIPIGTSKTDPTPGSVGEWVKAEIHPMGLMSYIGAILITEGYAIKPKAGRIKILTAPGTNK